MTAIITNDEMNLVDIDREEMEGLTSILKEDRKNTPLNITYDNICVYEFSTDMKTNPRKVFNNVLDFAETKIDEAVAAFGTKNSAKVVCKDSWQIKNGFITINICLHCYTEYDHGDFVIDDVATHRVVVTMIAQFDTKHMYSSDTHAVKVFKEVNDFHIALHNSLTA
jgi:hypothetical protein